MLRSDDLISRLPSNKRLFSNKRPHFNNPYSSSSNYDPRFKSYRKVFYTFLHEILTARLFRDFEVRI